MSTWNELEGKVALVTGASRGVGAATAVALAEAGCDVAVRRPLHRGRAPAHAGHPRRDRGRHRGDRSAWPGHPDEPGASTTRWWPWSSRTVAELGRLDILINNAAITFVGDLDIPLARYDLIMQVNLRAPMIAMRQAIPHMRAQGGGAIINVSSVAANFPVDQLMAYGVSKIGLERMSVDVARQVAADNIAVNVFRIDIAVASEGFVANTPGPTTRTGSRPRCRPRASCGCCASPPRTQASASR